MKKLLKQYLAFIMALLALWAGNGYGVLEHSCQEHGTHHHILSSWTETSCEHQSHEEEPHQHTHDTDSGFQTRDSHEQVNFVYCYAEAVYKASVQVASPLIIPLATITFAPLTSPKILSRQPSTPFVHVFRRTYGRFLLALVQSFLI